MTAAANPAKEALERGTRRGALVSASEALRAARAAAETAEYALKLAGQAERVALAEIERLGVTP